MAISTGAAILGGSLIGGGLGMLGAKKAGDAQKSAANTSANVQRYMFDQSQAMQAPWMQTGASALSQLAGLYGLTPMNYMDGTPFDAASRRAAMANFETSPGYQFRQTEGLNALANMASAMGTRAGMTPDILRYSQGLASDEFNNYTNRLAALAGIGQTSADNLSQNALYTGRGIGDANMAAGNARAAGIMGVANSLGNAANNAAWLYGYYNQPKPLPADEAVWQQPIIYGAGG